MSENFYTNIIQKGNTLLVRAIEDGKRVSHKVNYKPTFYFPTKKKSKFKTMTGTPVKSIQLGSISEAREFLAQYKEQPGVIYGMERYPYVWLADHYEGYVDWDIDKILILTIDIEVASENGFPQPEAADEEVLCITVKNHRTKKILVWGTYNYKNDLANFFFLIPIP